MNIWTKSPLKTAQYDGDKILSDRQFDFNLNGFGSAQSNYDGSSRQKGQRRFRDQTRSWRAREEIQEQMSRAREKKRQAWELRWLCFES